MPNNPLGVITYFGVTLQVGRLTSQKRAVYDDSGADYLFTHFVLTATCVWSPAATASNFRGTFGAGGAGDRAAVSIVNLRQKLLTPRQTLEVKVGADDLVVSPLEDAEGFEFFTDCNNGPHPVDFKILEIHGTKSVVCEYVIETWLNESAGQPQPGGLPPRPPSPLLSHRWEASERYDQDYLATRTTRGLATFRTDYLIDNDSVVDDFRAALTHPVPDNFQRTAAQFSPSEDGTKLSYFIQDEERPWNTGPGRGLIRLWGSKEYFMNWAGSTFPAFSMAYRLEAQALPGVRSVDIVSALLFVAAAHQILSVGRKRPFYGTRLTVDFPGRHAVLEANGLASGAFGVIPLFFGQEAKWPEDFGDVGGPSAGPLARPGPNQGLPNGSRGAQLLRLMNQINNTPDRPPAPPRPPETPKNLNP